MLYVLQVTNDQFIDMCILAGCYFINTFPPLTNSSQVTYLCKLLNSYLIY